jgi:hypothetical protein
MKLTEAFVKRRKHELAFIGYESEIVLFYILYFAFRILHFSICLVPLSLPT